MQAPQSILKEYWEYDSFRPLQEEIINAILAKNDVLALLPTGGGKSLCYQVPALMQEGICLVISPLIALMKDQVENLRKRGIFAMSIYSGMSRRQIVQTLKNAAHGNYKLLYVSPERLETSLFKEYLPAVNINLIAVDEAHCISQWGYDFRPSYLKIADIRKELPEVPVLALTASATEKVQQDICEKLTSSPTPLQGRGGSGEWKIFRQSYERKNLSYSVFKVDAKLAKLVDIVGKVKGTCIIYCKSRKRTVEIANLLQMHGTTALPYHAGLPQEERNKRQEEWIDNKVNVIVSTNAFGMGIDKPDVRLVIHADMPDCLENYYQEAGRAGRDGKKSYAVLLYDERAIDELTDLHKIRYPGFEQIKQFYASLVNYLQIPANTGEDETYTFRFDEFIRNFKLKSFESLYALKALESDGWLYFNEKSFTPSTLQFTTTKDQLYDFQKAHSSFEPLLTTLLRTYEGIFDFPAFISEKLLAQLLKKEEEEIVKQLKDITAFRIIEYHPHVDEPQIVFCKNRVPVEDLTLNLTLYNKRKEAFVKRVNKIIAYTTDTSCRSSFINTYFGDEAVRECGICDNCLLKKATELTPEEFELISHKIIQHLTNEPLNSALLLTKLNGIKKEKAWKVLAFLQAENKVAVDEKGFL
ncbi:MAG TPA: ATP-dependent DNA helicase RecQ, partial [Chitinophagaceae bacterium]|nr:ATP-dependent DNA helicase RecQ [Chitinophagaceae bacterium]